MAKQRVSVHADFFLGLAAALLLLPVKWVIAWIVAAGIHEVFHMTALILCKARILSVDLRISGASIETSPLPPVKLAVSALAGPMCFFAILPFAKWMPRLCVCAFAQSTVNLIPLLPMDGGRFVGALFQKLRIYKYFKVFQNGVMGLLFFVALFFTVRFLTGPILLIGVAVLYIRNKKNYLHSLL